MHAEQMAEESPLVDLDMSALAAVRLLAERRLPALVVTKADGFTRSDQDRGWSPRFSRRYSDLVQVRPGACGLVRSVSRGASARAWR